MCNLKDRNKLKLKFKMKQSTLKKAADTPWRMLATNTSLCTLSWNIDPNFGSLARQNMGTTQSVTFQTAPYTWSIAVPLSL